MNKKEKFMDCFFSSNMMEFKSSWQSHVKIGRCLSHSHNEFEIVYHPVGHGITFFENAKEEAVEFFPGSVVITPPDKNHIQEMYSEGRDVCILIAAKGNIPDEVNKLIYIPSIADYVRNKIIFLSSVLPKSFSSPLNVIACNHEVTALFIKLFESQIDSVTVEKHDKKTDLLAEKAKRYMTEKYLDISDISNVAENIGISSDYLRHIFRDKFNMSPKQFIMNRRLERVKELLSLSELPLKAIAEISGFQNERYLCTYFKKTVGKTPAIYRLSKKSNTAHQ